MICPLDQDIERRFDPKYNELLRNGEAIRWLALDTQGRTVGRIAAFYNPELAAAADGQPTGGCGFFESIDDQQVADLMFDAAKEWLAKKGMEAMDGPVNFGDRDQWWGLLRKASNSRRCIPIPTISNTTSACSKTTGSRTTSTSTPTCVNWPKDSSGQRLRTCQALAGGAALQLRAHGQA
ncbi:MAG: hypothetical protein ACLR8Y_01720 [Alistipes indistinctus]